MSDGMQMELWFHAYKLEALAAALEAQGTTVERRMQELLVDLYAEVVPRETQQKIQECIDAEYAAALAEREAARKYTALCPRENGAVSFFRLERKEKGKTDGHRKIPAALPAQRPGTGC